MKPCIKCGIVEAKEIQCPCSGGEPKGYIVCGGCGASGPSKASKIEAWVAWDEMNTPEAKEPAKSIPLYDCLNSKHASEVLETTLRDVIDHFTAEGVSVANMVGVLSIMQSEITLSFGLKKGALDSRVNKLIRTH